jgi:hypothetical protein
MAIKKTAHPTKPAAKLKRPRDPNQLAHALIQEMTDRQEAQGEAKTPPVTQSDISRVMSELGRRGGKIGGKRRMDTMTQEQRSQIAYKAAQARWAKKR